MRFGNRHRAARVRGRVTPFQLFAKFFSVTRHVSETGSPGVDAPGTDFGRFLEQLVDDLEQHRHIERFFHQHIHFRSRRQFTLFPGNYSGLN